MNDAMNSQRVYPLSFASQQHVSINKPTKSDSDLAFRVLVDGCKVFTEFSRRRRAREIERVSWCIYEWSLWILLPLSLTTIIQFYAKSASIIYVLLFSPIIISMLCIEFRSIRYQTHTLILIYKYAQLSLFTFFFIYHIICFAKAHTEADFVFFVVFTIHFVFYMFSLIRVFLIGNLYKIMLYRHQLLVVDTIRLV